MFGAQARRFSAAFTSGFAVVVWLVVSPGALGAGAVVDADSPAGVAAISAGGAHSCALLNTGELSCWGYNFPGQLGTGNFDTYLSPSPAIGLPGGATAVAVATGASHTCAVLNSGEVSCWGVGSGLGTGDFFARDTPSAPIDLPGGATATAISTGEEHSCAVLSTGEVSCWGVGRFGQLGTGDTSNLASPSAPIALPGGATATAISAGRFHTCALLDTGEVSCWGQGGTGQLGTGVDGDSSSPGTPVVFPDGATALAVSAGSQHSCAVLNTGEVSCWGFGRNGELGTGAKSDLSAPSAPIVLPGGETATAISAGGSYACALLSSGGVSCWGNDPTDRLPWEDRPSPSPPIALPGGATATAVSAGDRHVCVLLSTGAPSCWGDGGEGRLGVGSTDDSQVPLLVGTPTVAVTRASGQPASTPNSTVAFSIRFDQPVTSFESADVTVSGTAGATSATLTGGPQVFTATVSSVPDEGTVVVSVPAGAASGVLGLSNTAAPNTSTVTIDRTRPVATVGLAAGQSASTEDPPVRFSVTFDEPVFGFDETDVDVTSPPGARSNYTIDGSGDAYTVTVEVIQVVFGQLARGPLTLTVSDGAAVDAAGNSSTTRVLTDTVTVGGDIAFSSLTPARFADSRDEATFDGAFRNTGPRSGGTEWEIDIAGRGNVPEDATAAVLNITVVNGSEPGFATVYPCGTLPTASSVNYGAGTVDANEVIAKLSARGSVCVFTLTTVDVVLDVAGHVTDSPYHALTPARYADSRDEATFDNTFRNTGTRTGGSIWRIDIAGRGTVPPSANSAVVNLTVTGSTEPGFATAYPCTPNVPKTSSINYEAGATIANEVVSKLNSFGSLCVFTLTDVEVIVDVVGYLDLVRGYTALNPSRYADSRAEATFDNTHRATGIRESGTEWEIQIAGRGEVPAHAATAVVNLAVTGATGPGFATVYPCGTLPETSSINYVLGTTRANELIARLSPAGTICVFTLTATHLLIDVVGFS